MVEIREISEEEADRILKLEETHYLDVGFQQVVHPVLNEEAGVATLQRFLGGPDEHP
jgi:hypothetical protein